MIDNLAEEKAAFGAISFDPHVTLLSVIESDINSVTNAISPVVASSPPLSVAFSKVTTSDRFHQCCFLLVKPNAALQRLHEAVLGALEAVDGVAVSLANPTYMPHVSDCERCVRFSRPNAYKIP